MMFLLFLLLLFIINGGMKDFALATQTVLTVSVWIEKLNFP